MSGMTCFLDSNVLLYMFSSDPVKADRAEALVREGGIISVQVLNECANVLRRKLQFDWHEINEVLDGFQALLDVRPLTLESHKLGRRLAQNHAFSLYDSMIVASAQLASCDTLYSEDMQHEQVVVPSLKIIDPFRL